MNNISRIQQKLAEYGLDAMLVTGAAGRLFATGFASSAGVLIVTAADACLIADSRYYEAAQAAVAGVQVKPLPKGKKFENIIEDIISEKNITKLGFEDGVVSYGTYQKWAGMFGGKTGLVPAQKLINGLRSIKDHTELDKMVAAQRLAEKVFKDILPVISTDMSEKELAAEIIYRMLKYGADKESFDPIVVSGANSSRPHGVPGNCKINKGFLTIDFGVRLDGWCSDTTRTLCIGEPDDEMAKVYETVLKAQAAGISAVRGGVKGADVDAAARAVIDAAGYGEYFGHGFGHSLGLEVHEPLSASPLSEDTLPAGAVISAEPGIYIPGRFGVRIEDVLYITPGGCENITKLPKNLIVL